MGIEQGSHPEGEQLKEIPKREFTIGEMVNVMRSNGDIDSGWKVEWISTPDQDPEIRETAVTVVKETDQGKLQKTIPIEELLSVNE